MLNIIDREKPYGVILQFGGQTSVNMAMPLYKAGVNVLGTHPKSMDTAEDRKKFTEILNKLNIPQAEYGTAMSTKEALKTANRIGYPVLVRPSYVLGGRSMQVVENDEELKSYMKEAVKVSPEHPVLIDKFLENATELDIDAVSDGNDVFVAAIMEHIEEAGIHSGDSTCVIPPQTISPLVKNQVVDYATRIARELKVVGLINIQMAVQNNKIFVLEANPRASRTIPYVSKTIGIPLAKIATKIMLGKKLRDFGLNQYKEQNFVTVKTPVFPFLKLLGVDPILSPEMQSTGEVMGIDSDFSRAFYKAQLSANNMLPETGNILLSVARDKDKDLFVPVAKELTELGFNLFCTEGTCKHLAHNGIHAEEVPKVRDNPKIIEMMKRRELDLIIIIPRGSRVGKDGSKILRTALELNIPYTTTLAGTIASVKAIKGLKNGNPLIHSLDEYYSRFNGKPSFSD